MIIKKLFSESLKINSEEISLLIYDVIIDWKETIIFFCTQSSNDCLFFFNSNHL